MLDDLEFRSYEDMKGRRTEDGNAMDLSEDRTLKKKKIVTT